MRPVVDNRAVSAVFRVFGGPGEVLEGDEALRLAGRGAHVGEVRVLGMLVPLMVTVAVVERLAVWLGPWWAVALAVPALLVVIQGLTIVLGVVARVMSGLGGDRECWRWWCWLAALGGWAVWVWLGGGWARWLAAGWLLVVAGELACSVVLGWRRMMLVAGWPGVVLRVVLGAGLHLLLVPLALAFGWWALAWAGLLGLAWCRGTLGPNSQAFGPVASRCDGAGVWLTIDDGPDPETTPRLLDLLDEHGAKATFFVIGGKVERHPELAREIAARGHQLGNHTGGHPAAGFWAAGPWRTRREILSGSRAIESATGVAPVWFRAPVGHSNYFTHPVTRSAGMRVVGWTRRGLDGVSADVPAILRRLSRRLRRGDILVVHDAGPVAGQVLAGVLDELRQRGLRCELPGPGRR